MPPLMLRTHVRTQAATAREGKVEDSDGLRVPRAMWQAPFGEAYMLSF
jgi:hypothetical protein